MAKRITRVSEMLVRILKARGLESRLSEYRIFGCWERSVGRGIARHAQPQSLRAKKLTLVVDSPSWMQQLSMLKPEIMEKVNRSLGKEVVSDIALRLGEVALPREQKDEARVRADLSAEDRETIERTVQEISDPEIRDSLRQLIERDMVNKRSEKKK